MLQARIKVDGAISCKNRQLAVFQSADRKSHRLSLPESFCVCFYYVSVKEMMLHSHNVFVVMGGLKILKTVISSLVKM